MGRLDESRRGLIHYCGNRLPQSTWAPRELVPVCRGVSTSSLLVCSTWAPREFVSMCRGISASFILVCLVVALDRTWVRVLMHWVSSPSSS